MATTSNDALAAWKAQLAFKGKVRTSLIGDLLGLVTPSIPKREQEELQSLLAASGIHRGEQLRKFHAGKLLDMGVSEWVCKVLLEKEIIRSGISTPVAMSALAASRVDIKSSDLAIFDGGYASEELLNRLHKEFRNKPWLDLAKADMREDDAEALDFRKKEVEALYGYRAVLRTILREAPVPYALGDDECYVGSFYFMKLAKTSHDSKEKEWSRVVWMLQVQSHEMEFAEALGRLIQGMRKIQQHQASRDLAYGVVCGTKFVNVYEFHLQLGSGPQAVEKYEFTLYQPLAGFEAIVTLMCASEKAHGFVGDDLEELEEP